MLAARIAGRAVVPSRRDARARINEIAGHHASRSLMPWPRVDDGGGASLGPVQPQVANRRLGEVHSLPCSAAMPGGQLANRRQRVRPEPHCVDGPPALFQGAAEHGLGTVGAQVAVPTCRSCSTPRPWKATHTVVVPSLTAAASTCCQSWRTASGTPVVDSGSNSAAPTWSANSRSSAAAWGWEASSCIG